MAQGSTARKPVGQQTAFLRKRITRAGGAAQTVLLGTVPAGSNLLRHYVHTRVAFDGTTPVFSTGITGLLAGIVTSAANGLAALGLTNNAIVAATLTSVPDADVDIWVTFSVTGGTVGTADISLEYMPPDETP
jgi:hypothetical protein